MVIILPADAKHLKLLDNQQAQLWLQSLIVNNSKYVFF